MAEATRRPAGGFPDLTEGSGKRPTDDSKKWERRSDARPKELVSAALKLFAHKGFAGTRLEEVAAEAGVSKATVYLYFKNKEDLFEAVVREAVTPSLDQAEELVEAFQGSTADLLRTFVALFERKLEGPFPALLKLVFAESGNFPKLAQLWADLAPRRGVPLIQRILQRGIDRKELRPFDTQQVAPLVVSPVLLLALWKQALAPHTDFQLDPHALLAEHIETLIRGLSASGAKQAKEQEPAAPAGKTQQLATAPAGKAERRERPRRKR